MQMQLSLLVLVALTALRAVEVPLGEQPPAQQSQTFHPLVAVTADIEQMTTAHAHHQVVLAAAEVADNPLVPLVPFPSALKVALVPAVVQLRA